MSEKQEALAIPQATDTILVKTQEAQSNKLTRLAAFTPTNLTEAVALAKLIAGSDLAPKDYRGKPGNVLIAMQLGAELGVAPMQAIQNVAVINGRPSVWGDLALALVQAHPDYEAHKEWMDGSGDLRRAIFQIKRRGQEWHQSTFSVQDAKTAKLWGKRGYNGQDTPWITNPDRMLQMRARGFGLRDKFADALKGLKLAEEAMDLPPDTGKTAREAGSLDVNREIATMTASPEPNRGHGNEGMAKSPNLDKQPGMDQTEKKTDATMCGHCGLIGKHAPDCIHGAKAGVVNGKCSECKAEGGHLPSCSLRKPSPAAATANQEAKPEPQTAQSTPEAAEAPKTTKMALLVKTINERSRQTKDGKKQTYLVLGVIDNKNLEFDLYVWDKNLHEAAATLGSKTCLLEFSEKKGANNRTYCSLEAILEVAGEQEPEPEENF